MADRFLNSGGGGVAPYETSANAATTLVGLLAGATVAQDEIIWVKSDSVSVESSSAATILTSEGSTYSHPLKVISTDNWDDFPNTLAVGAKITTMGNFRIDIVGSWYFKGVSFAAGQGGTPGGNCTVNFAAASNGPHCQVFDNCAVIGPAGSSIALMSLGPVPVATNDPSVTIWADLAINVGNISSKIVVNGGRHSFDGLTFSSGSLAPAVLFSTHVAATLFVDVANFDLSAVPLGSLVSVAAGFTGKFIFSNGKLHASTGVATGTWLAPGGEILIINCDSGDTYTRNERHGYEGVWSVTATIYATTDPADMSVGAGDNYSIKMATSANVSRHLPLYSQWMQVWVDATAYTPSIEVLVGGDGAAALNSDELWIEVDYNSGTDSPLGSRITTCPDIITAGTEVAVGTTAWAGDGYTTERTHRLAVAAITPDKPGFVNMRVALAKPSTIIYVNPPR